MSPVDMERSWSFVDASGNRFWNGVLRGTNVEHCISTEASVTIAPGEPLKLDGTNSDWPRWDLPSTSDPVKGTLKVLGTTAAAEVGMIGVAIDHIKPGEQGRVAMAGCWVAVKCKNPPTSNVVGSAVISDAAVARQVDAVTSGGAYSQTIAHIKPGLILGYVAKPAGAGAGQIGSTTQLGIVVAPA